MRVLLLTGDERVTRAEKALRLVGCDLEVVFELHDLFEELGADAARFDAVVLDDELMTTLSEPPGRMQRLGELLAGKRVVIAQTTPELVCGAHLGIPVDVTEGTDEQWAAVAAALSA